MDFEIDLLTNRTCPQKKAGSVALCGVELIAYI